MADDPTTDGAVDERTETSALRDALAAEHAAVWGYGTVGAALDPDDRATASAAEEAHRDLRDTVSGLLDARGADPVPAKPAYALPFPVLSPVDAAALAVVLENGVAAAWAAVLARAASRDTRRLAADALGATEVRAVGWRTAAGQTPVNAPFPGLPQQ
jgi:Domain of unknown function (DUF4439)